MEAPAIERHLLYLIKNNERMARPESRARPKASSAVSEERLSNLAKSAEWFRKNFEEIPAMRASRYRTHWIGSMSVNADEQIKLKEMINELSKCNTNYDFRGAVGRASNDENPFVQTSPKIFPPGYNYQERIISK